MLNWYNNHCFHKLNKGKHSDSILAVSFKWIKLTKFIDLNDYKINSPFLAIIFTILVLASFPLKLSVFFIFSQAEVTLPKRILKSRNNDGIIHVLLKFNSSLATASDQKGSEEKSRYCSSQVFSNLCEENLVIGQHVFHEWPDLSQCS